MKQLTKKSTIVIILLGLILLVTTSLLAISTKIKVVNYTIESNKISSSKRLTLITDLHSCDYGENQKVLIDKIAATEPDFIALCGDIVDDWLPRPKAEELLAGISKICPCFYVSGNHECMQNDLSEIKKIVRSYDIAILEGNCINFNEEITICGVDDPFLSASAFQSSLDNYASTIDTTRFNLLLTHRPERIKSYLPCNFDLILAGHAHGGQWRIPFFINGVWAPSQGLFPQYAGGLYTFPHSKMIVSRGLSKEKLWIPRIFNRPEVVVIDIVPAP